MAVTLTLTGKTPGQTQFGLDTFTEHYKCDTTADVVLHSFDVPLMGSVHPNFPFMFVTARYCSETSEIASALDLTYTGTLWYVATDPITPLLPAQKHDFENAVQSATSSRGKDGAIATAPISVQFYAPTNVLTYVSWDAPGTALAENPTEALTVVAVTVGDTSITPASILSLVGIFFEEQLIETHNSTEIVPGRYWLNTSRKIKSYVSFVTAITPGIYISLANPGSGFSVGNTLTITLGGETATMSVDTLGIGNSVASFTVLTNSFTGAHNLISATGGSGSGAVFNVIVVT